MQKQGGERESWPYPVGDVVGHFVSQAVAGRLASDELKQHHAEAVDIASRPHVGLDVGRVDIAGSSHGAGQHVRCVGAEVGDRSYG